MQDPKEITLVRDASPSIRWPRMIIWALLLIFLVTIAFILYRTQRGNADVGERIPDFSLRTFDGQTISLSSLRGKVILINFWASWCSPCAEEAAMLEKAWQHYRSDENVAFIGVDYVDTETDALKYLQKHTITYPNGADLGTRISQLFRIRGVPETYILDPAGVLIYYRIGPFSSYDEIINIIDPLLPE
jgi:cytochrome c biogenesis protein CcmG/thiol:disulfide interchange protein DsbE